MKAFLFTLPLLAISSTASAEGLDFSGRVSMGLQGTTVNGETEITPVARLEGVVSYTLETDNGVTFVLALEFDRSLVESSHMEFLPGHR
ncbi:hypothetical protein [Gymnodinialimonas hymeniacidonis]|uniref:hypothetical protein n=1 Tax=Gymnodinialimonas hymeniacidonis TaxID=3126508 RepID=UPI0034C5E32F